MRNHFIIVGAQRSGTTYLYNILQEHPEICMAGPRRPEPKYFMNKAEDEISLGEYYESFFKNCTCDEKIFGEKSTSYYEREDTPILISSLLPNVKIIFFLRNPVNRAISNYFFSLNNGLENRSLSDVFIRQKKEPSLKGVAISVNPFDYLKRGMYPIFVKNYLKYFRQDQIKIIIFEDFVGDLDKLQSLYKFIGVDYTFVPKNISRSINTSNKDSAIIPEEVIGKLNKYYKNSVADLEELMKLNLASWKI